MDDPMPRHVLAVLALIAALLAAPAAAQQPPREAAQAALKSTDPVERGRGVVLLAREGEMADVPALLAVLRDPNTELRALAEQAIWVVWSRSGDAAVDKLFEQGIDEMNSGRTAESIATFTRIIEMKPDFAEGWNKRATIYFITGELQKSLKDCAEVMKRNPNHFGALAGYGQIYLQLGEYEKSLEYFKRALAVNPNMEGVEFSVRLLERVLEDRKKKSA
jgi:tetratricopeptide (TPR) repeat protein